MAISAPTTAVADSEALHRCSKCRSCLPAERFFKDRKRKIGLTNWCKGCYRSHAAVYYAANRSKLIAHGVQKKRERLAHDEEFRERLKSHARLGKRRAHADPAAYAEHLRRNREWRANNPDKVRNFKHMSKAMRAARTAARYAQKLQACPPWADRAAIKAVYAECQRLNALGGDRYEVDHIVPLKGQNVCGLHVNYNLRIIPADANRQKGNRLA